MLMIETCSQEVLLLVFIVGGYSQRFDANCRHLRMRNIN